NHDARRLLVGRAGVAVLIVDAHRRRECGATIAAHRDIHIRTSVLRGRPDGSDGLAGGSKRRGGVRRSRHSDSLEPCRSRPTGRLAEHDRIAVQPDRHPDRNQRTTASLRHRPTLHLTSRVWRTRGFTYFFFAFGISIFDT